jgi:long-chain acyl-CoA synthetase
VSGALSRITEADFTIDLGDRVVTRTDVEHEATARVPCLTAIGGEGTVVEVPAGDPLSCLAWLEASWRAGRAPLPRAGVRAPRGLELRTDSRPAYVIATSGSTGVPKFPWFDVEAGALGARRIARYLELTPRDVVAIVQPLEHAYALVGQLFAALTVGARIVWAHRSFPEEQASAIDEAGTTILSSVPFTLARLLDAGMGGAALRHMASAGGPLHARLAARLVERYPAATIWNQYGCTEAGPRLTACPSNDGVFATGSVGRAIDGVRLRLSNDGEIAFASDTAMRGYLGDETSQPDAGFWNTGDLGELDPTGALYVHGRVDDVVKHRGVKVALDAVARAVEACGARAALAWLVGEENPELVAAYEGDAEISKRAVREHLPLESLPARLVRVNTLPRLPNGKIDRLKAKSLL